MRLLARSWIWLLWAMIIMGSVRIVVELISNGLGSDDLIDTVVLVFLSNEAREWATYRYLLRYDNSDEAAAKLGKLVNR